jgi:hypothetical protein
MTEDNQLKSNVFPAHTVKSAVVRTSSIMLRYKQNHIYYRFRAYNDE